MKTTIRIYRDSDKPIVLGLLRSNTPQYFSPNEEKDLFDFLENHIENYFVLLIGNEIKGCGGFNLSEDNKTAKICWDIFHPDCQGKGFGSELTKFRIYEIKKIKSVKTISVRTSQLAYKFYEKFGFEIKEIVKDFWDLGFDLYRMECDVRTL